MTYFRMDIVTQSLRDLRALMLMMRANEAAINVKDLRQSTKDKARETAIECYEEVKSLRKKIEHHMEYMEKDIRQMEYTLTAGGGHADLATLKKELETQLYAIKKEYQHANNI